MKYTFFLGSIFLLLLASCSKEHMCDCFKGTGSVITETRFVGEFNRIEIHNNVKLLLVQDSLSYIKVSAGSKLISGITTTNQNGLLYIDNENKCNWMRDFENTFVVEVHLPHLIDLSYWSADDVVMLNSFHGNEIAIDCHSGAGEMKLNLFYNTMRLSLHTGVGDATVKGNVGVSYIYAAAQGYVHAEDLITGYTFINNRGTNDCYINVTKELGATIEYHGNIYYKNNPYKVDLISIGTGKLVHI